MILVRGVRIYYFFGWRTNDGKRTNDGGFFQCFETAWSLSQCRNWNRLFCNLENILTQIENSLHSRNQYFRIWFGYLAASFEWLPLHSTCSLLVDFNLDEIFGNFPQLFANHWACKIWGWLPCWTNSNVTNDIVWHRRRAGWGHVVHIPHKHTQNWQSPKPNMKSLFRSQNRGLYFHNEDL